MSAGSQRRSAKMRREREQARQRKQVALLTARPPSPHLERLEQILRVSAVDREQAQFKADAIRQLADEIDRDHGQTV